MIKIIAGCVLTAGLGSAVFFYQEKIVSILSDSHSVSATSVKSDVSEKVFYSTSQQKRIALVIGNANYENANELPNDLNDAQDMKDTLTKFGFEVIFETNANKEKVIDALSKFGEALQSSEVGLFYYSGHGVEVDGEQYIVPTDAKLKTQDYVDSEAISIKKILKKMGGSGKSQLNFVILDACRNNPFYKAWGFKSSMGSGFDKDKMPNASGVLIASATSAQDKATSAGGRNSVYTKHLLNYIQTESTMEIGLLLRKVRTAVRKETNEDQIPWENGAIEGEFYFAQKPVVDDSQKIAAELEAIRAKKEAIEAEAKRESERLATLKEEAEKQQAENKREADRIAELEGRKQRAENEKETERLAALEEEKRQEEKLRLEEEKLRLEEEKNQQAIADAEAERVRLEAETMVKQGEVYAKQRKIKSACTMFRKAAAAGNEDAKTYVENIKKCRT